ncbi:MAG TPA: hypothetical protein VFR34_13700 [Paracoccaceae bacterium]|nr:hypothetical protein [Paracoccaceae bacterium]
MAAASGDGRNGSSVTLDQAFPLAEWKLDDDYPYCHFRPYGRSWREAVAAAAGGSESVTISGVWPDGRSGTVTIIRRAGEGFWDIASGRKEDAANIGRPLRAHR